jgi:hypothetical protein
MDIALTEEIEEITAVPGSPKKNVVRVPYEDMYILSRSISPINNSAILRICSRAKIFNIIKSNF